MINYDSENEEMSNIDTDWIDEFEKVDKDYESFYTDDINCVNITIIYVNKLNEIDNIKEEKLFMKTKNQISKEEIIGLLKKNNDRGGKKFTIMTMLKYNFNLEPLHVRKFLLNDHDISPYLSVIKYIDDIIWEKTISMFHDLNNLIIIFYENEKYVSNNASDKPKTKRVYMKPLSSHNKTIKNVIK